LAVSTAYQPVVKGRARETRGNRLSATSPVDIATVPTVSVPRSASVFTRSIDGIEL
jgi:hypothetical protein